jgi:hypothetical protein
MGKGGSRGTRAEGWVEAERLSCDRLAPENGNSQP